MKVEGEITISAVLAALGISRDEDQQAVLGLAGRGQLLDDEISLEVEADEDELRVELDEEAWWDERPLDDMRDAFQALTDGERTLALHLFARLFGERELSIVEDVLRGAGRPGPGQATLPLAA
jgi:hypothetical protein